MSQKKKGERVKVKKVWESEKNKQPLLFTSCLAAPGWREREREEMGEEQRVTLDTGGFVGTYQGLMAK